MWWGPLLLILVATLPPGSWIETAGRPQGLDGRLADLLLNLALFAPFGAALAHRGRSLLGALLVGTLLSGGIETAQLAVPGRVTSLLDVSANAAGTVAGWVLWRFGSLRTRPDPKVAGRLAIAAAFTAGVVLAVTGLLLEPSFPATTYFGHWTPEFGHLRVYRGQVLEASVGATMIPSGPISDSAELRRRLAAGEPLRVRSVAGPPVAGLAPLLSINDRHHEVLLLGLDWDDLVYRFRTRAASAGLDSPELRVPGALRGVRAGDPLTVVVRPERNGYCVEVNGSTTCGIGFTAGTGWALLLYSQGPPPAIHGLLSILWMAALALPVGYWTRMGRASDLALVLLALAVLALPAAAGLAPTAPGEVAGALTGFLGGTRLRTRQRRGWSPGVVHRTRQPAARPVEPGRGSDARS